MKNDQAHSFATAENLGGNGVLPLLYDRITMNVECQNVTVAIWV